MDIPVAHYDRVNRLLTSLGKDVVVMDGADNTTNGVNNFQSFVKIGRMMSFQQQTLVKYNDIDPIATYSFIHEEIV